MNVAHLLSCPAVEETKDNENVLKVSSGALANNNIDSTIEYIRTYHCVSMGKLKV